MQNGQTATALATTRAIARTRGSRSRGPCGEPSSNSPAATAPLGNLASSRQVGDPCPSNAAQATARAATGEACAWGASRPAPQPRGHRAGSEEWASRNQNHDEAGTILPERWEGRAPGYRPRNDLTRARRPVAPGDLDCSSRQWHRCEGGTLPRTWSTCAPHPVNVGRPHLGQSIRRHIRQLPFRLGRSAASRSRSPY